MTTSTIHFKKFKLLIFKIGYDLQKKKILFKWAQFLQKHFNKLDALLTEKA